MTLEREPNWLLPFGNEMRFLFPWTQSLRQRRGGISLLARDAPDRTPSNHERGRRLARAAPQLNQVLVASAIGHVAADPDVGDCAAIVDVAAEADIARCVAAVLITVPAAVSATRTHRAGYAEAV